LIRPQFFLVVQPPNPCWGIYEVGKIDSLHYHCVILQKKENMTLICLCCHLYDELNGR
jgi:hypothetical protein